MNKQLMIDKIYKKIANKELSFGCKYRGCEQIICSENEEIFILGNEILDDVDEDTDEYGQTIADGYQQVLQNDDDEFGIMIIESIGHKVFIGDVWDWIEKSGHKFIISEQTDYKREIDDIWKKKRLPIEEQSELCVSYVFNLINKEI